MSLLPGQILPPTASLGTVNEDGTVTIEQNWWLLLYNLALQVLGTSSAGLPADALIDLASADADAIDADAIALRQSLSNALIQVTQPSDVDADAIALRRPLSNALVQAIQPSDVVISTNDLPDLQRALLLAQADIQPDPVPLAQPVSAITVGASPFTYTASFAGSVAITGSVTSISFKRQGISVATGMTTGMIPVCRYDQLVVTYPGAAPTMTFIPWSSQ